MIDKKEFTAKMLAFMSRHNFQPRRQKIDCSFGKFPALIWKMLCVNGNGEVMVIWEEGQYDREMKENYVEEPCIVGRPDVLAKYDLELFENFWVLDTAKKDKHGNLILAGKTVKKEIFQKEKDLLHIPETRMILKLPNSIFDFNLYLNGLDE
jgi:hypothetical protein